MHQMPSLEPLFPDRGSSEGLTAQLVRKMRTAIQDGFFPPSTRLLPSRDLAKRLGVARNTVTMAFQQLIDEGYLEARTGSGTFVAAELPKVPALPHAAERAPHDPVDVLPHLAPSLRAIASTRGALRIGTPDLSAFPSRVWERLSRAAHAMPSEEHLGYRSQNGLLELRESIAQHLAQFRGIAAAPDQVAVVNGTQAALNVVAVMLAKPGEAVVIEDPCYPFARAAFELRGLTPLPVPVDEHGLKTAELPASARLAYVTPSHQFPIGGALPLMRRAQLLRWAQRANAYVIEDDYDSEFNALALPALQSLDSEERVIYVGTFSKTLAPGLRLGYIVAPPHLRAALHTASSVLTHGIGKSEQRVLAAFIRHGYFTRHIRRMSHMYARRRRILTDALRTFLPREFVLGPDQDGLHLSVLAPPDFDDVLATQTRLDDGQQLLALSVMCVKRTDCRGVILGIAGGGDAEIAPAARVVAQRLLDTLRRPAESVSRTGG